MRELQLSRIKIFQAAVPVQFIGLYRVSFSFIFVSSGLYWHMVYTKPNKKPPKTQTYQLEFKAAWIYNVE